MLNPDLDRQSLREEYEVDGRIRINDFLEPEVSHQIRRYCLEEDPFDVVYFAYGKNQVATQADMENLNDKEKEALNLEIANAASRRVGFVYGGYMMGRSGAVENPRLKFLSDVFEYFNGETMLEFVSDVTGARDLSSADCQYTKYTPGHFLTRHRDDVSEHRRIAYILGFSENWHPDWGGLLQFFQEDGTARDAWIPRFNCLSLFDIKHIHSVTFITPFAKAPRVSLTGWFRSGPGNPTAGG